MKKLFFSSVAMLGLLATSCSSDEPMAPLSGAQTQIGYNVTANGGSRALSAYENGTDVHTINVSAWATAPIKDGDGNLILDEEGKPTFELPGYGSDNGGNASLFLNDRLTRSSENGKTGTFNYSQDARYWPMNGEKVDFFAMVDNEEAWGEDGVFDYTKAEGKPGTGYLGLLDVDKMPDMLYAHTFGEFLKKPAHSSQQNVSFHFDHAFAKVVVTAEVKNKNLRVVLTGISFHGIIKGGIFHMPYISGEGPKLVDNPASWTISSSKDEDFLTNYPVAEMTPASQSKDEVILDLNEGKAKEFLIGGQTKDNLYNDVLMFPYDYNGRNGSNKYQTYIKLTGYAYNIAGDEYDEDCDMLVYGKPSANGPVPAEMIIPIEFNWVMGTINRYNIIFDCGNGGNVGEDPNNPALVRIGYEVEVNDWKDVDNGNFEYPDKL